MPVGLHMQAVQAILVNATCWSHCGLAPIRASFFLSMSIHGLAYASNQQGGPHRLIQQLTHGTACSQMQYCGGDSL